VYPESNRDFLIHTTDENLFLPLYYTWTIPQQPLDTSCFADSKVLTECSKRNTSNLSYSGTPEPYSKKVLQLGKNVNFEFAVHYCWKESYSMKNNCL